ncbi:DUF6122 family protein [Hymenobacter sublimis]|uniref:DUF6122 family protein n=1 Tax=Hymenobacter sublimis TaxID=2933777 RepID=A0ABY4JHV7_9BACT|nr:DUF6122 family protein [Hymenobacter sublimis]UPL51326.1 DUF6122 family protein [Hymenobacter sublimis]
MVLAGCRSSAVVPKFSAAPGYHHPPQAQRGDTAAVTPAREQPTTQQGRVKAEERATSSGTQDRVAKEKKEPAVGPGSRQAKATPTDTASSAIRPMAPPGPGQFASPKLFSAQTLVHYGLHFVFPLVLALVFFPLVWQTAYLVMLATMAIDLDRLLAKPIFDPLRCSVGYHPLHSFHIIPVYALLLLWPATQIVAVGLLFHMFTDTVDCLWNFSHCQDCYRNSRIRRLYNGVRKLLGLEVVE